MSARTYLYLACVTGTTEILAPPTVHAISAPIVSEITISGNERTRSETIRHELLFKVGDRLDSSLVNETERNLRRLLFLGEAAVSMTIEGDSVSVRVRVRDLYSRALSPKFSGQPSELSYGLVALDYNILGRGQTLQLTGFRNAISGDSVSLLYHAPRLTRSRHIVVANAGFGDEGHHLAVSVNRPFYKLASEWAYGASVSRRKSVNRLYSNTRLTSRYTDQSDAVSLWITHSAGNALKLRPGFRLSFSERLSSPSADFDYQPPNRRRVLPSLSITLWRPRFVRARFINQLGRVEDLQVGSWTAIRIGLSHSALGSDRNYPFATLVIAPRFWAEPFHYAFGSVSLSSRYPRNGYESLLTTTQLLAYSQLRGIHTIALRLRLDTLSRSEQASQYLLGVNSGLRGYSPRGLDGSRRFIANGELRPTLLRRRHYVVAGTLFADGGTAWDSGNVQTLRIAVGAGARLGFPSIYDSPILRFDFARGLQRGGLWQVSFGMGQYF